MSFGSSDGGTSDDSVDESLLDNESTDDLSSEGEHEDDDLYQSLPSRLVYIPLMKTQRHLVPILGKKIKLLRYKTGTKIERI